MVVLFCCVAWLAFSKLFCFCNERMLSLALTFRFKSLVLTLMCYGGPDTIDWSYILPDDDGRVIRIPTNKQGRCRCPWFLVLGWPQGQNCGPNLTWPWPFGSSPC